MGEFKDRGGVIEQGAIDHVLATTHQEMVEGAKEGLENPEIVRDRLNTQVGAGKRYRKEPSRVTVCSDYLIGFFLPQLRFIRRSEDPVVRAYARDVRIGFYQSLRDLCRAEIFIKSGKENLAIPVEHLTVLKDLLIHDNTGVSILRHDVELLNNGALPTSMMETRHLPFALAGAQLAYDLYTEIYPLSQNLPDATYHS